MHASWWWGAVRRTHRMRAGSRPALSLTQPVYLAGNDVKAIEARQDGCVKGIKGDIRKLSAVTDNLSYRITTNEQAASSTTQTVGKVQDTLSQLGGDIRLVMEILPRMEAAQKKGQ